MKVLLFSQKLDQDDGPSICHLLDKLNLESIEIAAMGNTYAEIRELTEIGEKVEVLYTQNEVNTSLPDLILSLGGDGTMLKAAALAYQGNIPIIGINLGRLGFLSSVEKTKIHEAIDKIKAGHYHIESRSMLELNCNYPIFTDHAYALNDFTIHKRDTSSMVTIHTFIDGVFLNTYWSDGIIVATPTGSTGYSLACGGPIIFPGSGSFVITPIAPHNLNVRPLIIRDDVEVSFEIEGRAENFLCTLDSKYEPITDDYKIAIKRSKYSTRLMILEGHNFMSTMREKLLWGLDKRN
ncbi:MAG: NAD kinase [Saprospiraceae bacterium]|nr:NAD kinase [Saprospiraceae bacterium]